MKKYMAHVSVFILVFAFLSMAACSKQVQPTIYSGLKSEISQEAKDYNMQGMELAQNNQYKQAIEAYKKAIMMEPAYAEAYINCSKAYYAIGNYDMARFYNTKSKEIIESKATVIHESGTEQTDK